MGARHHRLVTWIAWRAPHRAAPEEVDAPVSYLASLRHDTKRRAFWALVLAAALAGTAVR